MRVLLTNDDGIEAAGLQALRRRCSRSTGSSWPSSRPTRTSRPIGRGITTRRPLWVEEVDFGDGTIGYATDGTPVDCVRFAALGLVDGFEAELIVSGINHGSNLGDDITYSGTVAAALEGVILGLPAVAVSQQSNAARDGLPPRRALRLRGRRGVHRADGGGDRGRPAAGGHAAQRQRPGGRGRPASRSRGWASASTATSWCCRTSSPGGGSTAIYGDAPEYERQDGTDLAAVAEGRIAVTPLHFDLTDEPGIETLRAYDLARLLEPAAREIDGG